MPTEGSSPRAISSELGLPAAVFDLILFLEGANGLRNRLEPFARNRLATHIRLSVGPLRQLLQGTLHAREAIDIPNYQVAGQLEIGELLRVVLVFPRTVCAFALDIGLLVLIVLSGRDKGVAKLHEVLSLPLDEFLIECHRLSPVGPNRSVLMADSRCPSPSSWSATVSTNGVGPHTKICGSRSGWKPHSASMSLSTRRLCPTHPSGTRRVSVWTSVKPSRYATSWSSSSR